MRFVEPDWLAGQLDAPDFRLVDPRLRVRYLSGHLKGALHAPMRKALDAEGRLLPNDRLAAWLGSCGVSSEEPVVLYDQHDGQAGAMLAWILGYLGHPDVRFLRTPFEEWRSAGRELFYRPVEPPPARFEPRPRPELRATFGDLADGEVNILDARSPEEFAGERTVGDDPAGRIPGARNIPHLEFVQREGDLFASPEQVRSLLAGAGLDPSRRTVVYCRAGTRAAVVTLALLQAGVEASLYDGSWADWSRRPELPVEV